MEHVNEVTLRGEMASDPEVRATRTGREVGNLFLLTRRAWTGRDGRREERVDYHRGSCWGELVEQCRRLRKGDPVCIKGRLQTRSWTDRDGNKRYTTEVVASELEVPGRQPPPAHHQPDGPDNFDELPF